MKMPSVVTFINVLTRMKHLHIADRYWRYSLSEKNNETIILLSTELPVNTADIYLVQALFNAQGINLWLILKSHLHSHNYYYLYTMLYVLQNYTTIEIMPVAKHISL